MTNPTNTLSVETLQLFSAAKLWARVKAPYFGRLLSALVPCVAPDAIKTMGVTMGLRLFINDAFARSLTVELFGAVLLHGAGHVIRRHAVRCEAQGFDPELFNIAGDLAINDDIRAMGVALPACVIFPELYGLPRGLTAEDYYERLAKQGGKPKPQPGGQGQGKGGDKGPAMPGDGDSCGSCSGHRAEGEPAPGEGDSPEGERPQVEVAAIAKATAEAVRQYAAKNAGKVPGGLLVWAEVSDAPSPVRWQDMLARAVRRAIAYRPGGSMAQWAKPPRHQGGLGYGAGAPRMPSHALPVPRVLALVDTSGSMGGDPLAVAMREVGAVLRAVGAPVGFVACDTVVHNSSTVTNMEQVTSRLLGGGGSDMRPAFDAIAARKDRPGVVVAITDGYVAYPEAQPRDFRVVWVLVGETVMDPPWGEVLRVPT